MKIINKLKSLISTENKKNLDDVEKLLADLVLRINKAADTDKIHVGSDMSISLDINNSLFIQSVLGICTVDNYFEVIFFCGEEETSFHSSDYNSYEEFISEIVSEVCKFINQTIKFVNSSDRKKCICKKSYKLMNNDEWELIDEFTTSNKLIAFFITKTKLNEKIYKFQL